MTPEPWRKHLTQEEAKDLLNEERVQSRARDALAFATKARKRIIMRARARLLRSALTPAKS